MNLIITYLIGVVCSYVLLKQLSKIDIIRQVFDSSELETINKNALWLSFLFSWILPVTFITGQIVGYFSGKK